MQFFFEVLIGGLLSGVMYCAGGAGFRADLQGLRGVQLRPGGDGVSSRRSPSSASRRCCPGCAGLEAGGSVVFWLAFLLAFVAMTVLGIATENASCCGRWSTSRPSPSSWPRMASAYPRRGCRPRWCWVGPTRAAGSTWASSTSRSPGLWTTGTSAISQFDLIAAGVAASAGRPAGPVLPIHQGRPRPARRWPTTTRRRCRSASRCRRIWAIVWGGGRLRRAGCRHDLGRAQRRAVRAHLHRARRRCRC